MTSRTRASTRASTAASESLAETMSEIKSKGGDSRKTPAVGLSGLNSLNRPLKKEELQKLRVPAVLAMLASNGLVAGLIWASLNDHIKLYPTEYKLDALKSYPGRAEFALRHQTLLLFWLLLNILMTIFIRITRKAINPLVDSTEKHVAQIRAILSNSYEQIVLSILAQLAFISFASPELTLKLIPLTNFVQFFGRITFYAGYPMFRTFGIMLSLTPNSLLVGYNIYRLGQFYKLY